ncbi:MAG: LysM domain-containing protein [Candidatus Hydrogenedentales bacterium]
MTATPDAQTPLTPVPTLAASTEPIVVDAPLAIVDEPPLAVEPPSEYVVQTGQTLSKIAALYQLDVRDVQWWNGMENPNSLSVGQTLYLQKRDGLPPRDQFFARIAPPPKPEPAPEEAAPLVPVEPPAASEAAPAEDKPEKPKKRGWWPFPRKKQSGAN